MREQRIVEEKLRLIEKELITLTDKIEEMGSALQEIEDIRLDVKALKVFLGKADPEFKKQFPGIVQKIIGK